MDAGEDKRAIVARLEAIGAAFIDVGMGLELVDGSLGGIAAGDRQHAGKARPRPRRRVSFAGGGADDVYASNIQVADLNALNAVARRHQVEEAPRLLPGPRAGAPLHLHDRRQSARERRPGMMRWHSLEHRFVQHLPDRFEPGVLYVSMEYATASHSCCCGCGEEVVTPFSPVGWRMTFDGETVSLWPSVGSWTLRCRSHYVIDCGNVREAGYLNNAGGTPRRRDDTPATRGDSAEPASPPLPTSAPAATDGKSTGWWARLRRWFSA